MADYGQTIAQCLTEAGFDAVGAGSAIWYPGGAGGAQAGAFHLAEYECNAKYTLHPKYYQRLTEQQFEVLYDYDVQWLVPCLESLGAMVSTPPTRETYIAQRLQGKLPWDPYNEAEGLFGSPEKGAYLANTCPKFPVAYLWG